MSFSSCRFKYSSRKLATCINISKDRLYRLRKLNLISQELLDDNIQLALDNPHYQPIYSIREISVMMEPPMDKRAVYKLLIACHIDIYWMGHKRIVLLTDLHKLDRTTDYKKSSRAFQEKQEYVSARNSELLEGGVVSEDKKFM
jgi:hypothetical protein